MDLDDIDLEKEWEDFKDKIQNEVFFIDMSLSLESELDITSNVGLKPLTRVPKRVFDVFVELGLVHQQYGQHLPNRIYSVNHDFYRIDHQELKS